MSIFIFRVLKCLLYIISKTLPGVPDTTWSPCSNRLISSDKFFPPMQQCIYTFIKSPNASPTFWLYSASSRVGESIKTYGSLIPRSRDYKAPNEKTAVLPVPDYD